MGCDPGRVTMDDQNYVYLENVTVQGEVRMHGASNMVVRGCHIKAPARGSTSRSETRFRATTTLSTTTWWRRSLGRQSAQHRRYNGGEGIQFTGSGHVVCFNHVKGFRDDISLMEYDEAYEQVSIDICNNDIEEATTTPWKPTRPWQCPRGTQRVRNCFDV